MMKIENINPDDWEKLGFPIPGTDYFLNHQGDRYYLLDSNKKFAILDKDSEIDFSKIHDSEIVKTIVDKRGKEVNIIKIFPHKHKLTTSNIEGCKVCEKCGVIERHDYSITQYSPKDEIYCVEKKICKKCNHVWECESYHELTQIELNIPEGYYSGICENCGFKKIVVFSDFINELNTKKDLIKEEFDKIQKIEKMIKIREKISVKYYKIKNILNQTLNYLDGNPVKVDEKYKNLFGGANSIDSVWYNPKEDVIVGYSYNDMTMMGEIVETFHHHYKQKYDGQDETVEAVKKLATKYSKERILKVLSTIKLIDEKTKEIRKGDKFNPQLISFYEENKNLLKKKNVFLKMLYRIYDPYEIFFDGLDISYATFIEMLYKTLFSPQEIVEEAKKYKW